MRRKLRARIQKHARGTSGLTNGSATLTPDSLPQHPQHGGDKEPVGNHDEEHRRNHTTESDDLVLHDDGDGKGSNLGTMKRSVWPKMEEPARAPARGRRGVGSDVPNGAQGARASERSDRHNHILELGLKRHWYQEAAGRGEGTTMSRRGAKGTYGPAATLSQNGY